MNLDGILSTFSPEVRESPSMKGLVVLIQTLSEQLAKANERIQNENENQNWAEFQTLPNATRCLCTFLTHTIRSLVRFSMGWNNLWVFIDFLHLLFYLLEHIYGRCIYSIVTLINTHSLKFMPGVYHCGVFATIPYFVFQWCPYTTTWCKC